MIGFVVHLRQPFDAKVTLPPTSILSRSHPGCPSIDAALNEVRAREGGFFSGCKCAILTQRLLHLWQTCECLEPGPYTYIVLLEQSASVSACAALCDAQMLTSLALCLGANKASRTCTVAVIACAATKGSGPARVCAACMGVPRASCSQETAQPAHGRITASQISADQGHASSGVSLLGPAHQCTVQSCDQNKRICCILLQWGTADADWCNGGAASMAHFGVPSASWPSPLPGSCCTPVF